LAVAASIVDSFGRGNWNLDKYALDLEDGLEYMVAAARPNDPRCITLRYEDVVADTDGELGRVFEFLGLDASEAEGMSDDALRGRMRDRTGVTTYSAVSPEPLTKWHRTMGTALRRSWCRRYLERLGPVRLQEMGYDYDDLMRQVDALPRGPQKLGSDIARRVHGKVQVRAAHRLLQPSSRELEKQAMARQAQLF
jgi:hypothetical protein